MAPQPEKMRDESRWTDPLIPVSPKVFYRQNLLLYAKASGTPLKRGEKMSNAELVRIVKASKWAGTFLRMNEGSWDEPREG